jgi:hypothetical protein
VQLAEAQAQAAAAESRETVISEAMKEAVDRHVQELKDAYLVTKSKRRMLALEDQEPIILEGIPIMPLKTGKRLAIEGPSASHPQQPLMKLQSWSLRKKKSPSSASHHQKMTATRLLFQRKNHR